MIEASKIAISAELSGRKSPRKIFAHKHAIEKFDEDFILGSKKKRTGVLQQLSPRLSLNSVENHSENIVDNKFELTNTNEFCDEDNLTGNETPTECDTLVRRVIDSPPSQSIKPDLCDISNKISVNKNEEYDNDSEIINAKSDSEFSSSSAEHPKNAEIADINSSSCLDEHQQDRIDSEQKICEIPIKSPKVHIDEVCSESDDECFLRKSSSSTMIDDADSSSGTISLGKTSSSDSVTSSGSDTAEEHKSCHYIIEHNSLHVLDPDDLPSMLSIEALEVNKNSISIFPENISILQNLKTLLIRDNHVSTFPASFIFTKSDKSITSKPSSNEDNNSESNTSENEEISAIKDKSDVEKSKENITANSTQQMPELKEFSIHKSENDCINLLSLSTRLPNLENLSIVRYPVSGFSASLSNYNLTNLTFLRLRDCQLRNLPSSIEHLPKLQTFDISWNCIRILPETFCSLINLVEFNCSHNELTTLPLQFSCFINLIKLDLSHNFIRQLPERFLKNLPNCLDMKLNNNPVSVYRLQKRSHKRKVICPEVIAPVTPQKGHTFMSRSQSPKHVRRRIWKAKRLTHSQADIHHINTIAASTIAAVSTIAAPAALSSMRCSVSPDRATSSPILSELYLRQQSFNKRSISDPSCMGFTSDDIFKNSQQRIRIDKNPKSVNHINDIESSSTTDASTTTTTPTSSLSSSRCLVSPHRVLSSPILSELHRHQQSFISKRTVSDPSHMGFSSDEDFKRSQQRIRIDNCPSFLRSGQIIVDYIATARSDSSSVDTDDDPSLISLRSGSKQASFATIPPVSNPRSTKRIKRDATSSSRTHYSMGYLSYDDELADGFYDCGRQCETSTELEELMSKKLQIDDRAEIREIILVDSRKDKGLRDLLSSARKLISQDSLLIDRVRLLAMFVSDSLGGRNSAGGQLFVLADEDLKRLRLTNSTNIIKLGELIHGVCRHRSILFKYLADSLSPKIPSALVRGYRMKQSFDIPTINEEVAEPHAWNLVKIDGTEFIVDTLDSPHLFQNPNALAMSSDFLYVPQCLISVETARRAENSLRYSSPHQDIHQQQQPQIDPNDSSQANITETINDDDDDDDIQHVSLANLDIIYNAHLGPEIGRGSYAIVHECRLGTLTNPVNVAAKKSLCSTLNENSFAKLLREFWIHPYLKHPNIVRFHGYLIRPPRDISLFMERVNGPSLLSIIHRRREECHRRQIRSTADSLVSRSGNDTKKRELDEQPLFSTDEILHFAFSIIRGISYLHSKNVIHRDIKSDNILINFDSDILCGQISQMVSKLKSVTSNESRSTLPTPDPSDITKIMSDLSRSQVKICDFNVSVIKSPGCHEMDYCGTMRWVAPEVITAHFSPSNRSRYNNLADVWSFAIICIELLTGVIPYSEFGRHKTEVELAKWIHKAKPPDLSSFKVDAQCVGDSRRSLFVELVKSCLVEHRQRPSAEEVVISLLAIISRKI